MIAVCSGAISIVRSANVLAFKHGIRRKRLNLAQQ